MPVILTKKSDTPSAVPTTANLTNAAGGAELAINTADKRLFSINSSSAIIEVGTNPSSLTCADASFTVARIGSLTITNISGTSLTVSTATLSGNLTLSAGTANGVLYLNGSKVATSGSALTFDGTNFATTGSGTLKNLLLSGGTLPGAGNPSISLRSSDNVIYHQSGSANTIVMLDSSQNTMQSIGATAQIWNISNAEQMRLTSTGLGIGTTSPASALQVQRASANPTVNITRTTTSAQTLGESLYLRLNDTVGNSTRTEIGMGYGIPGTTTYTPAIIGYVQTSSAGQTYGDLYFATRTATTDTAPTERARITANGNLCVGTTVQGFNGQGFPLIVGSGSGNTGMTVYSGTTGYGTIQFADANNSGADSYRGVISYKHGDEFMYFSTNATERARITAVGELCVGTITTTSGARLDVKGVDSTSSNYCVFFENSGSALLLAVQNDGRWRSGTAAASPYNFVVGATNRDLFVDNDGEIGYVSSVRASKTNIAPVADTDWLLRLNPVTFNFRKKDADGNYTDEADGPIKHGLIAEEVEAVNSDLCFYDDEDKGGALRGVNYSHLITPMLKLIQNQQAMINELKAKVAALEA